MQKMKQIIKIVLAIAAFLFLICAVGSVGAIETNAISLGEGFRNAMLFLIAFAGCALTAQRIGGGEW